MYMEMTELDTYRDLQDILICAIPRFEFPRFDIFDYELGYKEEIPNEDPELPPTVRWVGGNFNAELTLEEMNILAVSMMVEWFERQLATIELTREKYSGADFKFTSQANHMAKLKLMVDERKQETHHLQRLYKRRIKGADGTMKTTMSLLRSTPD